MVQRAVHFAPILGDVIARVRDGMLLAPDLSKSQKSNYFSLRPSQKITLIVVLASTTSPFRRKGL